MTRLDEDSLSSDNFVLNTQWRVLEVYHSCFSAGMGYVTEEEIITRCGSCNWFLLRLHIV